MDVMFLLLMCAISIHALRGEGDTRTGRQSKIHSKISIHALRGEGDLSDPASLNAMIISIHALRGEGDPAFLSFYDIIITISIHALRGEGDCKNIQICNAMLVHSAYKTIYFCDSCAFYLT